MLTILLIILLLALVGAFPAWPYSAGWGLPKRQFGPASLDPYRRSTGSQAPGTLGSGKSVFKVPARRDSSAALPRPKNLSFFNPRIGPFIRTSCVQ
jgi:hypothetical protein